MAKDTSEIADKVLKRLIEQLTERLGRVPQEHEVIAMIKGTTDERMAVWNQYEPPALSREQRRRQLIWQRERLPYGM